MILNNPEKSKFRELFFYDLSNNESITRLSEKYLKITFMTRLLSITKKIMFKLGLWHIYLEIKSIFL